MKISPSFARTIVLSAGLCGLGTATFVHAQGGPSFPDEILEFNQTEAWAMKYFAAVGLMQGDGAPSGLKKGQLALGFELSNIPHLSKEKRTVGFRGTKTENLNKAPVLARPLIHYGITDRLSVTAAYVPPIEVFDHLKTHLAGVSINYTVYRSERFQAGLRAIGQWTEAEGDFTGPADIAGNPDPAVNPLGVQKPSEDVFTSWTSSLEADVAWILPTKRTNLWHFGVVYTYADLDFEINALLAGDFLDNRHQVTDGSIWSFNTGIETQWTERLSTSIGLVYVPLAVKRPPDFSSRNDAMLNFRFVSISVFRDEKVLKMRINLAPSRSISGRIIFGALCLLTVSPSVAQEVVTVTVEPARDNTVYSEADESNGQGSYLFAGRTLRGERRRALLAFDLAGVMPPGAVIQSASLSLRMNKTIAGAATIGLHPVLSDWGEGASNATLEEGSGIAAQTGDATWRHTKFPTTFWGTPGGDFTATASATTSVSAVGAYTWSGAGLATDVQAWVDDPSQNFGWMLVGPENAVSGQAL